MNLYNASDEAAFLIFAVNSAPFSMRAPGRDCNGDAAASGIAEKGLFTKRNEEGAGVRDSARRSRLH